MAEVKVAFALNLFRQWRSLRLWKLLGIVKAMNLFVMAEKPELEEWRRGGVEQKLTVGERYWKCGLSKF